MPYSPAQLFRDSTSIDEFRAKLIASEGDFSFCMDDMIELGKEYFARYPDSFSDRNMKEVHAGYAIVRTCILEKMLNSIDTVHRSSFRALFGDVSRLDDAIGALQKTLGVARLKEGYQIMNANLENLMAEIESIPKGMIKERFIGGITTFFNIMYLIKSKIAELNE